MLYQYPPLPAVPVLMCSSYTPVPLCPYIEFIPYPYVEPLCRPIFPQPSRHAPAGSVAFGALMLPALPSSGLPTHWLSRESNESLRRWCYYTVIIV